MLTINSNQEKTLDLLNQLEKAGYSPQDKTSEEGLTNAVALKALNSNVCQNSTLGKGWVKGEIGWNKGF